MLSSVDLQLNQFLLLARQQASCQPRHRIIEMVGRKIYYYPTEAKISDDLVARPERRVDRHCNTCLYALCVDEVRGAPP